MGKRDRKPWEPDPLETFKGFKGRALLWKEIEKLKYPPPTEFDIFFDETPAPPAELPTELPTDAWVEDWIKRQ